MKALLIVMAMVFSTNCFAAGNYKDYADHRDFYRYDNDYSPDPEWLRYLETINYRINNLRLLNEINENMKQIRCQNEVSDFCDNLLEKDEED